MARLLETFVRVEPFLPLDRIYSKMIEVSTPIAQRVSAPSLGLPQDYAKLLEQIKARVHRAQVKSAVAVNRGLIQLYWQIGRAILKRQRQDGWGSKVVERLARDLRDEFPNMRGLSRSNLLCMRAFADAYPQKSIVQQLVGQLPWGHNVALLQKVKTTARRIWYAQQTLAHGWSRALLIYQIESGLHGRQGKALTNFKRTLPAPQSDLAQQVIKDPYTFDFMTIAAASRERDLEQGLLDQMQRFLLELGVGFAFVGRQVRLEVGGEDFSLDLLFYHLRLRCYVVIELKTGPFKPEYAGKMNFYLAAVDERLRHKDDRPSLGLVLCKSKNRLIAEYALRDMLKPIGVAAYELTKQLPAALRGTLPTIEQLEARLKDP